VLALAGVDVAAGAEMTGVDARAAEAEADDEGADGCWQAPSASTAAMEATQKRMAGFISSLRVDGLRA
jgi:hypothetical protein